VVQWLRLQAPNAGGGPGLIPGQGTRSCVLQLKTWHSKTENKKIESHIPPLRGCSVIPETHCVGLDKIQYNRNFCKQFCNDPQAQGDIASWIGSNSDFRGSGKLPLPFALASHCCETLGSVCKAVSGSQTYNHGKSPCKKH